MIYRSGDGEGTLLAYSDTDFVGCLDTRKSTGDYLIFKNNNLISWQSKLQGIITLSITKAEYVQINITIKKLEWLQIFNSGY